jgi:hypothetical protein
LGIVNFQKQMKALPESTEIDGIIEALAFVVLRLADLRFRCEAGNDKSSL